MGPPLGLGALSGVIDDERVEQRQVAEQRIRGARGRQAQALAGQPLQRAVLAEVDDRVGAPVPVQPAVAAQVVVGGGQVGVVVDRHRVLAEAPRRLDREEHIAELQAGEGEVAVVDLHLPRRRAPLVDHGLLQVAGELGEPFLVALTRQAGGVGGELVLGEELGVEAAGGDEAVHEPVAVEAGLVPLAGVVAGGAERVQGRHGRGGGVQADAVADAAVLGRIVGEHYDHALICVLGTAQPGKAGGDPGHAAGALGVGDVGGQAVGVGLFEAERHGHHSAVEFGDGDLHGGIHG